MNAKEGEPTIIPFHGELNEKQKEDLKNLLTKELTRAEGLIMVLYYYEEMTIKEVAAELGLSESRVSQMHSSIIARLKSRIRPTKYT